MRLTRPPSKLSTDNNLMPMINVVFLLLIFFMVAGTIDPPVPIDTDPPDSSQRRELSARHTLHIGADGAMALNNDSVYIATLSDALLREPIVPSNVDLLPSLAVCADGNLPLERLRPVLDALREAGIAQIELVTTWALADKP